jgi:CubicO group peptidase (beta-lactamase class C family)
VPPALDTLQRTLDAAIPAAMARDDVPGVAVGICDADGSSWSACYGTTARGSRSPVTPDTTFSVQSTSKLVTATLTMRAVQLGLVDLDAPISTYVPEFTVNSVFEDDPGAAITLRHLLAHTAGFTHEAPLGSNFDLGNRDFDAHCRSIFATWLRFPVGHHHEYSNLGIDIAGLALERAGGMAFADFARRELLEPLGLERSTFDPALIEAEADRAIGHWRPFEKAGRPLPVTIAMVAAGGMYTSVDDALRFVSFHLRGGDPLIPSGLLAEQYRVPFARHGQELGYGLGVYVDEWAPGVRVLHHGGSGAGFQAQLGWAPELGRGLVVLANSFDTSLPNDVARRIIEQLATDAAASHPQRPAGTRDQQHSDLGAGQPPDDDLPGQYVGRLDDAVAVRASGDRLIVQGTETRAARLVAPRTIELDTPGRERYRFEDGPNGPATYMLAVRDGTVRYRNDAGRTPSSTLDPARTGDYVVRSWGVPTARYRLAQDGPSPVLEKLAGDRAGPSIRLRLAPIAPDLYLSSMGEVLDLRAPIPTYANVPLEPAREDE